MKYLLRVDSQNVWFNLLWTERFFKMADAWTVFCMFKIKTTQFCSCLYFSLCHKAACFQLPYSKGRVINCLKRYLTRNMDISNVSTLEHGQPNKPTQSVAWAVIFQKPDNSSLTKCSDHSCIEIWLGEHDPSGLHVLKHAYLIQIVWLVFKQDVFWLSKFIISSIWEF